MRNVFGGLSFNLTRVAAEGHQGPHLMTATIARVEGGENLNLVPYISMCKISSTAPSLLVCARVCVYVRVCVPQLTVALTL